MNQQKKVLPVAVTLAVLAGVALGAFGFYFLMRESPQSSSEAYVASTSTPPIVNDTGTVSTSAPAAATSSVDTSSWQTYTNYELGFTMQYPPDVTVDDTSNPTTVVFSFPSSYFSTVMRDQDSVSVAVNATCTPMTSYNDTNPDLPSQTVTMNGITFTENYQYGVGAGNHQALTTYDTYQNNSCYRISFTSRGANDAGLYGGDPAQIAQMNAAHAADDAHVQAAVNAMIATFSFANTGAGENEAYVAATASSSYPSSSISITSVNPSTASVGGTLSITGAGFSGEDTSIWISNGTVNGVVWEGQATNDSALTATVPGQACTVSLGVDNPNAAACPSYLVIDPGIYTLTVSNQNGTTDPVYVKIQ